MKIFGISVKLTGMMMKALLFVAPLLTLVLPVVAQAAPYEYALDTYWTVSDTLGNPRGKARNVCLTPTNCGAGAIVYGYPSNAWTANIPGASWVWAEVDPKTSPANNAKFTFQTSYIWLCDAPRTDIPQIISVAADNEAEVILNGVTVLTSNGFSSPKTVDLSDKNLFPSLPLRQGQNIIQVKANNGSGCDQYQCNPAGVVLKASFADILPALPTCTDNDSNRTPRKVGYIDKESCPQGQSGNADSICACLGSFTWWQPIGACVTAQACTDYNYSSWGECSTNGQQTRTYDSYLPAGCTGTPQTQPKLTQSCPYIAPACTSFTYGEWGECMASNTQTRTVLSKSPAGCTGGTPDTTRTCPNLPLANEGDMCWSKARAELGLNGDIATCPSDTECTPRTGIITSSDKFCDPVLHSWPQPRIGVIHTNDGDIINYKIEANSVPADQVEFTLKLGTGINWRKELILIADDGRWALFVQDQRRQDTNGLYRYQLPNGRLLFRKAKFFGRITDIHTLFDLNQLPNGARVTFTWVKD